MTPTIHGRQLHSWNTSPPSFRLACCKCWPSSLSGLPFSSRRAWRWQSRAWMASRWRLGWAAGTVIWSSTALLGLNVLFHAFPPLFLAMKIAGALFLLWIAYQIFRHAAAPVELGAGQGSPRFGPFMQGFLTQISNPKVVVFFGSIFVSMLPAHNAAMVSFNEVWWYSLVALFFGSGPVRGFLSHAPKPGLTGCTGLFLGVAWRAACYGRLCAKLA